MSTNAKYREYFDIDDRYFPCIDAAAIEAGAPWKNTYPHTTFIDMLNQMERALARQNNGKTLWIEGAYGTGKSQCAYALRKILEVPEDELRAYWDLYEPLKSKGDLLQKLIGHKQKGIVVAHRYASGGIMSARDLFFAIQESVREALISKKVAYLGENTLKASIIAWLEDVDHQLMVNSFLNNSKKKWKALFSQSNVDEILAALKYDSEVKSLVDNIFTLADEEGITALSIDSDRLINWLTDIIDHNNISIVLIWDEFSDYFRNNRESLSEFQKIASLVQNKPFYFIVVTHEPQQIYVSDNDRGNQSKVSDRFVPISIVLPDNIAFDLLGHAFNIKPAAKQTWDTLVDGDLGSQTSIARKEVMQATSITNERVLKNILPIHPMTALLLKNIAQAFKSNQRSMFDFIKTSSTEDVKAFQWFIDKVGPFDDHPVLTVDMLWDFFYEKGKNNLSSEIRLVLDTFQQQKNLREDEAAVLKAILIMQAIDLRLGGVIDLLKATEQNISYVFAGISSGLDVSCKNIAKGLKNKGVLVSTPLSGGRSAYTVAVLAGDQVKIDSYKKELRKNTTTSKLVNEGELSSVLSLSPALRLRFDSDLGAGTITPVTSNDFTRIINSLRDKPNGWKFHAIIAFAKDDSEATAFRRSLVAAVKNEQYKDIVIIDALSAPLGFDLFEQYVDYTAMAMYYQGNNNLSSRENADKAKHILNQDWKNKIYNGPVIIYTYSNQEGIKVSTGQGVGSVLQTLVTTKFPYVFDFARNLTESQLKSTPNVKQSAKSGITQITSGLIKGVENIILSSVWNTDNYWIKDATTNLPISKIKLDIEKLIQKSFSEEGQISIGEIYDFLQDEYGFAPSNLSAFIIGFLLKEYGNEQYRYTDTSGGHEQMTPDKLAEMIGNYISKTPKPKPTYLVKMTAEEMAFYTLTENAWGIPTNSCSSAGKAGSAVSNEMRKLGLPVWCLENVVTIEEFEVIQLYIELVQKEGNEAHRKAVEIGRLALANPSLGEILSKSISLENCQEGMSNYLRSFENGKIYEVASSIGAQDNVLGDISQQFAVEYSCLWDKKIGEEEIQKLFIKYNIVKLSNDILNTSSHSLSEIYDEWRNHFKFIGISHSSLRNKYPVLHKIFDIIQKILNGEDLLHEKLKIFNSELETHSLVVKELFENYKILFKEVYKLYLEGLSDDEIIEIMSQIPIGLFMLSITECNSKVKDIANEYRKNLLRSQLSHFWKEKTNTTNPNDWSNRKRTPILCCVPVKEFEIAKKSFEVLNNSNGTDEEIKAALAFLNSTTLFEVLNDKEKCDEAFRREIIGNYSFLLSDIDRVRDDLDQIPIGVYEWRDNPNVRIRIQQLAEAEYNSGGSDKVVEKIEKLSETEIKTYLTNLIMNNITVGIEILNDKGGF